MNANAIVLLGAIAWIIAPCHATSVGLGTIEQPVNLGADSDPSRIPLGRVATESNYHYGRGPVISAPRPSLHGAMEWKEGSELDQNLASVFGLEVSNHDLPHSPATIHLKARPIPAYSPYTKDQVLAATIHCLLRSNQGTPKQPIQLEITAESPDDQPLVEKFSGEFINASDEANAPKPEPTPVPGSRIETDARGIAWVVFPGIKPAPAPSAHPPALIPFLLGGDFGPDDSLWRLLPVWTGSGFPGVDPLGVIGRPYPLFYDCFNPSTGAGPEANALFAGKSRPSLYSFDIDSSPASIEALIRYPDTPTKTLAASILALVVSAQPTAERPLTVTLETGVESPPEWYSKFKACKDWKSPESAPQAGIPITRARLSCTFVWDAKTATLIQGSVPVANVARATNGELIIEAPAIQADDATLVLPNSKDSPDGESE